MNVTPPCAKDTEIKYVIYRPPLLFPLIIIILFLLAFILDLFSSSCPFICIKPSMWVLIAVMFPLFPFINILSMIFTLLLGFPLNISIQSPNFSVILSILVAYCLLGISIEWLLRATAFYLKRRVPTKVKSS